jgi:raffinose/stachyose/melibiose transport system substrate-binding protein
MKIFAGLAKINHEEVIMTVKKLFILPVCLVLAVSMSFAGGGGQRSPQTAKTSINFWTWRPEEIEGFEELLGIFESQNPGIDVIQTAHKSTEYNTILSAALSGGSGPDVFMARTYGGLETFAQSGYLEPLDARIPELKNFSDAARRGAASVSDGKIYGVPIASQTLFVFYNTEIYSKLGLQIPKTWAQFLANCEAVKKAGITPIGHGGKDAWILEIMLGTLCPNFYGGTSFYDKVVKGETNFLDPVFVAAVDRLNELKPYVPDMFMGVSYDDARSLFINEQSAHFIGGSFEAGYFSSQNPSLKYDLFAPPTLNANDPSYVSVYADGNFAMNAASSHKEAVTSLLHFFASKTTGDFYVKSLKQVSAVPGADTSSAPFIAKVIGLQKNNTPYIFLVGFRYEQPTGSTLAQAALQGMFGGQLTAAQVCQQIQDGIASYYKPFQK